MRRSFSANLVPLLVALWCCSCSAATHDRWQPHGPSTPPPRTDYLINRGWRFLQSATCLQCEQPLFDDSAWRSVNMPHDFIHEAEFDPNASMKGGYLSGGTGWYRRHVSAPHVPLAGRSQVFLHFEAVMASSTVFLDGTRIAQHLSGYTPFRVDVTAAFALSGGKPLLLLVCANATVEATYGDSSDFWWYNGGGIYRNAWLTVMPQVGFIPFDGIYAPALVDGESIVLGATAAGDTGAATLLPSIEIGNNGPVEVAVRAQSLLIDPRTGVACAWASSDHIVGAGERLTVHHKMAVAHVSLWSPDAPALYTHQALVRALLDPQLAILDTLNTTIGFRHARFDPELGFFLNQRATKIRGTANHQDFAGVGVAVPDALQTFRVRALKAIGMNAWRTAHNAPTAALLEAADREGMLVWDENHRNGQYEEAATLVLRDRNHASVIIWSLCNEILCKVCPEAGQPCVEEGWLEAGAKMRDIMLALDPLMGRPVSANQNAWLGNSSILTLQGIDYAPQSYDELHANAPLLPAIGSEVSSAYSDRAIAFNDEIGGHVRAYDTEFPAWGNSAQDAWQSIWSRSFMAGAFSWTGFDYRGEPTPYQWPSVASHFGILDSAGFKKDRAFWYEAWNLQPRPTPVLHLFPHWNFVSGQEIDIWAYSNADEVELFLNGASLGRSACGNYSHAAWPAIPWVGGELRAVAYFYTAPTEPVATAVVRTTGPPQTLRLSFKDDVGADGVYADGRDVALLQVEVLDAGGDLVPYADTLVEFSVQGGEAVMQILGSGNGDPSCHVPGRSRLRPAFGGRVSALLQSTALGAADGTKILVQARAPADVGVASDVLEVVMRACDSDSGCSRVHEL